MQIAIRRWIPIWIIIVATSAVALLLSSGPARATDGGGRKWVATWATSPAAYFVYAAPPQPLNVASFPVSASQIQYPVANIAPDLAPAFPNRTSPAGASAVDQTFRSMVKPDLWGNTIRIRFSNVFGNKPLTFDAVTVGLQEYAANIVNGTLVPVTFGNNRGVTIPAGERVWSDPVLLPFVNFANGLVVQGRNLAISYSVTGDSGHMTYHNGAFQTSYITAQGGGDHTEEVDGFAYEYTTASWFFLDAVDVMAPASTVVICAFGDSITDGVHTTMNGSDRWANVLSRRLHGAYGDRVSVVNAGIAGNHVGNPVVPNSASGPAAVDRLERDVLSLSGLTHVIWLEGINDLGGLGTLDPATAASVIAGYQDVVSRLHSAGVKVHAGTLTSALGVYGSPFPTADNGAVVEGKRQTLNYFIRNQGPPAGLFDGIVDFDAVTLDLATGNVYARFLPNSQFTQLPWDYLHPNHAGYNAMGLAVEIAPFAP
jgi:lysophospholipase L1-like esterase